MIVSVLKCLFYIYLSATQHSINVSAFPVVDKQYGNIKNFSATWRNVLDDTCK